MRWISKGERLIITKRVYYTSGEEFTDIEINLNTVEETAASAGCIEKCCARFFVRE